MLARGSRFALPHGPFCLSKQAVRQCCLACFAGRNGPLRQWPGLQRFAFAAGTPGRLQTFFTSMPLQLSALGIVFRGFLLIFAFR